MEILTRQEKKNAVIKFINDASKKFWDKFPNKNVKNLSEDKEQLDFSNMLDEETAEEIVQLLTSRKDEQNALEFVHSMCVQSVDPEKFEAWEEIKKTLIQNRINLK